MRFNLIRLSHALSILCLGFILMASVQANDSDDESLDWMKNVGAYPVSFVPADTPKPVAIVSPQAPPAAEQKVMISYNTQSETPPSAVFYSGKFVPWGSFSQQFQANFPMFWVSSSAGWSWYATCPVGRWIQNLMYVPITGTMKLYEFYPDGSVQLHSYGFATPGYKYIPFYADTPGRHMALFTIFDKPSNYIVIDVE